MKSDEQAETLLPTTEKLAEKPFSRTATRATNGPWWLIACVTAASLGLGYFVGRNANTGSDHGLLIPAGTVQTSWQHNLTFTQKPTPESEAAWSSLIPVGRGFVHHESVAPFISNIAVFHELHCMHAIIVAYYDALESPAMNLTDVPDREQETATRIKPSHVRHCFDYIRQALICSADTNLEVVDHETHEVNGWGQPKTCQNFDKVFAWAEKYANSTDTGIITL